MKKVILAVSLSVLSLGSFAAEAVLSEADTNFVVDYAMMRGVADAKVTQVAEATQNGHKVYDVSFRGVEQVKAEDGSSKPQATCGHIQFTNVKTKKVVNKVAQAACSE